MKTRAVPETFVTPHPWALMNKRRYGNEATYELAARWLAVCYTVADWGGGGRFLFDYLDEETEYVNVDGTKQNGVDIVADLACYRQPSEGILLRHVIDNTFEPWVVLANAMASYTLRLVVVTYTPHASPSRIAEYQYGWPVWHLDHDELIAAMGVNLKHILVGSPGSGERLFCLEKPCAS